MSKIYVIPLFKQRTSPEGETLDTVLFSTPSGIIVEVEEGQEDYYTPYLVRDEGVIADINKAERALIPTSITMKQARLQLLELGLLDDVEAAIADNKKAQIEWEYASTLDRDNPLVLALATNLGLSETDVDNLFIEASKIK